MPAPPLRAVLCCLAFAICTGSVFAEYHVRGLRSGTAEVVRGAVQVDGTGTHFTYVADGSAEAPTPSKKFPATGRYEKTYYQDGWDTLFIDTDKAFAPSTQMFAAGYLEGAFTHEMMHLAYKNMYHQFFKEGAVPANITSFMADNVKYTREQVSRHPDDHYWQQVGLIMAQFNGLLKGYNDHAPAEHRMGELDMWLLNLDGDMEDIQPALAYQGATDKSDDALPGLGWHMLRTRCSALIRLPKDKQDLFMAHSTWDSFGSMLRVYKHYNFAIGPGGSSTVVSFSSTPGFLSSVDDWYVTSNGLAITETTNGIYGELYNLVTPTAGVMSFIRCMVASFNAHTGPQWVDLFSKENSGTYNNQWIVIDAKLFEAGQDLPAGTVTLVEQIPGECHKGDVSAVVNKKGFWSSYNIPYYEDVYKKSGFVQQYKKFGDEFSWSKCPRAQIFARDAPKVEALVDMKTIMRYNDWEHDPLSLGSPENAVVSRFDLDPDVKQRQAFGGIDSKISSARLVLSSMETQAINGPTSVQQPVFKWSESEGPFTTYHFGQPDVFNFDWKRFAPATARAAETTPTPI